MLLNTSRPIASVAPGSLLFATTAAGQYSASQAVTIRNDGSAVLRISSVRWPVKTPTSSS